MKKIILLVTLFIAQINFAQNTFPVSGNVGIGTVSPLNGLQVFKLNDFNGGSIRFGHSGSSDAIFSFGWNSEIYNDSFKISYSPHNSESNIVDLVTIGVNGNVGIGTTNPTEKLEIYNSNTTPGIISLKSSRNDFGHVDVGRISAKQSSVEVSRIGMPRAGGTYTGYLTFWTKADNGTDLTEKARITESGNVGIGTSNPLSRLNSTNTYYSGIPTKANSAAYFDNQGVGVYIGGNEYGYGYIQAEQTDNVNIKNLTLQPNGGNVGIGTTSPDEKLTVKGKIHTQEIRVDLLGALVPDYVFANDYKLKPLQEVEEYVKSNNHLPEIPSAKEIEKNGLMLAEMNMSLLKKIEEMTLYMIEQDKQIQILKKENETFKSLSAKVLEIENKLKTMN